MNFTGGNGTKFNKCFRISPLDTQDYEVALVGAIIMSSVIVVGFCGNILSLMALKYSSRSTSSNFYLQSLAIADALSLMLGFSGSLTGMLVRRLAGKENYFIKYFIRRYVISNIRIFFTFYTRTVSVYIIVLFTIERCLIINRPHYIHSKWTTTFRAKIYITILVVLSFLSTFPAFFAFEVRKDSDGYEGVKTTDIFFFYRTYNLIILSLIPAVIIVFCNVSIFYVLWKRKKNASLQSKSEQEIKKRQHQRVTRRLLLVSTAFVVLSFPLLFYVINDTILKKKDPCRAVSTPYGNALTICLVIYSFNYCINFALYCLTARQFRLAVRALLTCNRAKLASLASYLAANVHTEVGGGTQSPTQSTNMTTASGSGLNNIQASNEQDLQLIAKAVLEKQRKASQENSV